MPTRFSTTTRPDGMAVVAIAHKMLGRAVIAVSDWPSIAGPEGRAAKALLARVSAGEAKDLGGGLLLSHSAAADLPNSVAELLFFPPVARLSATLSFDGRIDSPEGTIRIRWYDHSARAVTAERVGCVVRWGHESGRLSKPLFRLVEAADRFNETMGAAVEQRICQWQPVQEALKGITGREAQADPYLGSLTIYQAGAFALDVRQTANGPDFDPILMSRTMVASADDNAPIGEGSDGQDQDPSTVANLRDQEADALLPPDLHRRYVEEHFRRGAKARDSYVLGRNVFLVLDSELKTAINVVHGKRAASREERHSFVRNPRPAIAAELGHSDDDPQAGLFVETQQYSDRVLGLGIWEAPSLPWLKKARNQWLPESFSVNIGQRTIELTPETFGELDDRVAKAKTTCQDSLDVLGQPHPVDEVDKALSPFRTQPERPADDKVIRGLADPTPADDGQVLRIKTNIEGDEYEATWPRRHIAIPSEIPRASLANTLPKPHQIDGFRWLVDSWAAGWPGVLLADDMGLGKTFQALSFLAWFRSNRQASHPQSELKRPMLVVAPTALLRNWIAETQQHLAPGALGDRIEAFGTGLGRIKRPKNAGWTPEDAIDVDAVRGADWILTTYETLADYHRAFARIAYSIAVFDEMQKVKAPGSINTNAAKAMNADFVVGLTGTPIENRLEDIWCIMDRVVPGYLGNMKSFSKTHASETPDVLTTLKAKLDQPVASAPPVMLRRMKESILEGLPSKTVKTYPVEMPPAQAQAYASAVRTAQSGARSQGAMLKAVHALRGISLHPEGAGGVDGYDARSAIEWVEKSARLRQVVSILREIERAGAKALVFVEDRAVQSAFAASATTLLGLRSEPAIINGQVPGPTRQAIVDRFQGSAPGFDLLVLSPKAAGIGLTITAANHVIHLSRWWNPAVEDQCNDRVYRIGQKQPVTIHVPLAIHPDLEESSFDATLDRLLDRRRTLSRTMLTPPVAEDDVGALFRDTVGAK